MRLATILPLRTPQAAPAQPEAPLPAGRILLGEAEADGWLGGGLKADGLHEACPPPDARPVPGSAAAALAFLLLLAERKRRQGLAHHLIWARKAGASGIPYGPGLVELGLDPAAITLLLLPDRLSVLRAGLDALRHGGASVLIDLPERQHLYDLTASRRLALAAEASGALALVLRPPTPSPSAAHTRWQVAAAPSAALEANAPGHPAFALTLLRQRGGREGLATHLAWNRDDARFQSPAVAATPLFGAVYAVASGRKGRA